jgi:hypothetical protein
VRPAQAYIVAVSLSIPILWVHVSSVVLGSLYVDGRYDEIELYALAVASHPSYLKPQ